MVSEYCTTPVNVGYMKTLLGYHTFTVNFIFNFNFIAIKNFFMSWPLLSLTGISLGEGIFRRSWVSNF
jgi:hypothetical protein